MPTSAIDFKSLAFPNLSTISKYPALTVGLAIFTFVLLIIDLATSHALAKQKLEKPISLLDGIVVYYKEEDAIATRGVSYNPLLSQDVESAVNSDTLGVHYRGEGHVLGNNTSA
ncbi:hypothetical protein QCA50_014013 [Cerrena zonata]|uniref:Dirigent protein n=1 Tax=Cerrena zonata TaxID=2478898 RepID=A0AAW0FNX2_9APHY